MHSRTMRIFIVCLICCVPCLAAQVEIAVTGANGAALKDALVIVQDLQGKDDRELFRALTDVRGNIPPHTLAPGVYRAIAVFPYSHRENSVSEFLVRDAPVNLHLRMAESQGLDDLPVSIGQLTVHVISPNGQPAVGARVLVRDAEAHPGSEHWGTTNAQGSTTLELKSDSRRASSRVSRPALHISCRQLRNSADIAAEIAVGLSAGRAPGDPAGTLRRRR